MREDLRPRNRIKSNPRGHNMEEPVPWSGLACPGARQRRSSGLDPPPSRSVGVSGLCVCKGGATPGSAETHGRGPGALPENTWPVPIRSGLCGLWR